MTLTLLAMYYLPIIGAYLNSYKGLTGVLGTVIIYAILLLLILVLRPLSSGCNHDHKIFV